MNTNTTKIRIKKVSGNNIRNIHLQAFKHVVIMFSENLTSTATSIFKSFMVQAYSVQIIRYIKCLH